MGKIPEKSRMPISPRVSFVLLRINFQLCCLLPVTIPGSAVPGNLTLHFGIRCTNHPATAMKQHEATCLSQCHCSQCDGERLSDSEECLSPQVSRAPGNRNVPSLVSPVLTRCLSFEANLPLAFSTEGLYLHLVLLAFCSSPTEVPLPTLSSVQTELILGPLSQGDGGEAWGTHGFQEAPSLPVSFPTLPFPLHFCQSCLTTCLLRLSLACLFFHSSVPMDTQELFNRSLASKNNLHR